MKFIIILLCKGGCIISFRHLLIFVTVCMEGSISAAAKKLYLAQPSVSLTIKELEEHFGQNLFDRLSRKLYITPFGSEVYQYAQRIIAIRDELEQIATSNPAQKIVRVGTGTTIANLFIPKIVKQFNQLHPDIDLTITIDRTSLYPRAIAENKLDIVIMEKIVHEENIIATPLQSSPIVAVCHKEHPLARKECVTAEDFAHVDVLLREKNSATRTAIDLYFDAHRVKIHPKWESIDVMALITAVQQNIGVSFFALSHIYASEHKDLVILNIEDFKAEHNVNLYCHRDKRLSPSMNLFIEFYTHYFQALSQENHA